MKCINIYLATLKAMMLYHRQWLTSQIWLFATCPWCLKPNLYSYLKKDVWNDPKLEVSELIKITWSYYLSLSRKRNEPRLHYYKLKVLQVGFPLVNWEIWLFKLKKWNPFSLLCLSSGARWQFLKNFKNIQQQIFKHFWIYIRMSTSGSVYNSLMELISFIFRTVWALD